MNDTGDRAFWLHPPHDSRIEPIAVGAPAAGELRVRSRYSAVSRGTETLVYAGGVPASEYERMRAPFQAGALPGPVRHGYANVGVVEAGPDEWLGREVFCLYSHQTRYVVPVDAVVALARHLEREAQVLALLERRADVRLRGRDVPAEGKLRAAHRDGRGRHEERERRGARLVRRGVALRENLGETVKAEIRTRALRVGIPGTRRAPPRAVGTLVCEVIQ